MSNLIREDDSPSWLAVVIDTSAFISLYGPYGPPAEVYEWVWDDVRDGLIEAEMNSKEEAIEQLTLAADYFTKLTEAPFEFQEQVFRNAQNKLTFGDTCSRFYNCWPYFNLSDGREDNVQDATSPKGLLTPKILVEICGNDFESKTIGNVKAYFVDLNKWHAELDYRVQKREEFALLPEIMQEDLLVKPGLHGLALETSALEL